jgi:hypothetical protein
MLTFLRLCLLNLLLSAPVSAQQVDFSKQESLGRVNFEVRW